MIFSGMRDSYFNTIFVKPANYVRAGPMTKKLNWCGQIIINQLCLSYDCTSAKRNEAIIISSIELLCFSLYHDIGSL
jgi:hypothetical protein